MSGSSSWSRAAIVGAIVMKDLREFSRDRVWALLTPLSMAFLIVSYWFLPNRVDEEFTVGICPPALGQLLETFGAKGGDMRGLEVVTFDDEEQLLAAIAGELEVDAEDDILIGISFPENFVTSVWSGQSTTVSVLVDGAVPSEVRFAVKSGIREAVYGLQAIASGSDPMSSLPVAIPDPKTIILGEDLAGAQVPLREKMLPMLLVVILIMEALALGGLVAVEIAQRTITAVLVTPARVADVMAAKVVMGALLGMGQGMLFLVATGSFGSNWPQVILLMMLGATLASAVGMIAGAAGHDFIGTLFLGGAFVAPLMIPAFASLFPGSTPLWVQALPSYGLVEAMIGTVSHGHGWSDVLAPIGIQVGWVAALLMLAVIVLRRRVVAL